MMNTKSFFLTMALVLATASGTAAQSLLDLPGLLGLQQQTRTQENAVKVEFNSEFQYFFDLRSFTPSKDIFLASDIINVARFSPSVVVRFDQNRDIVHRVAFGVDLTKNLGEFPTAVQGITEEEHDPALRNWGLLKDFFFYYNYQGRIGKGLLDAYVGIHPRSALEGDYTRAIFADDIWYYDPNLEGVTVKYSDPRFQAELTADLLGKKGIDRIGGERVFTAGSLKLVDWAAAGWSASYTHVSGSLFATSDVDCMIFNPYVKIDFAKKVGIQQLSVKAGALASYQYDYRIEGEEPHFPMGAEVVLDARHWNLGLENTFYYGDNQMIYYNGAYAEISQAADYVSTLYSGETFYFTRRGIPTWYDRAELYWKPFDTGFVKARLSGVAHFITPAGEIGPYIGMQAKATLLFNLDAFRHPRQGAGAGRARDNRGNRDNRDTRDNRAPRTQEGPRYSL